MNKSFSCWLSIISDYQMRRLTSLLLKHLWSSSNKLFLLLHTEFKLMSNMLRFLVLMVNRRLRSRALTLSTLWIYWHLRLPLGYVSLLQNSLVCATRHEKIRNSTVFINFELFCKLIWSLTILLNMRVFNKIKARLRLLFYIY